MTKIYHFFLMLLIFGLCAPLQAQDPVFSQHFAIPMNLNPAFAGVSIAPRISTVYRHQWPSWPNAYQTYAISYEHPVQGLNSSFGLMVKGDDAGNGIYQTNAFTGVYSYQIRASRDLAFILGLEAGFTQTRLDWEQLIFEDQLDPRIGLEDGVFSSEVPPEQFNRSALDLGMGLMVYHSNYYAGLSVKHLNRADENWLNINNNLSLGRPMRITFHTGAEFSVNANNNRLGASFISPNLLYIRQGPYRQVNAGAYAGYESVFGGIWYRHTFENADAAILMAGVRYNSLRIAYSYDVTLSGLSLSATGGSHEISVSISLEDSRTIRKNLQRRSDINNCFKIFN